MPQVPGSNPARDYKTDCLELEVIPVHMRRSSGCDNSTMAVVYFTRELSFFNVF